MGGRFNDFVEILLLGLVVVAVVAVVSEDDDKDVTSRDENVVADGGADGADGGGRMIAGLFRAEVEVTETGRLRLQLLQVPSELKIR